MSAIPERWWERKIPAGGVPCSNCGGFMHALALWRPMAEQFCERCGSALRMVRPDLPWEGRR